MHNKKVFIGNLPWYKEGFYGVRAGSRWPHFEAETNLYMPFPFQLAYAAAILEQIHVPVLLVDAIAEKMSEENFTEKILRFSPDLILFETSTPSFNNDIRYIKQLKEQLSDKVTIALCGPHAPMFSDQFFTLFPFIDVVLVGEYELTLKTLVETLSKGMDITTVPGIRYHNSDGDTISTGPPNTFGNIDEMPWPARHFLPMDQYHDNPGNIPAPSLQIWSSRGCPYGCTFCIWPQIMDGNRYRARQPGHILDEIASVCEQYNLRSFYFDDDTFNIGKKRVLEFCRSKIERRIDLPWAMMARADLMDSELLQALRESDLKAVKYGIESADQHLLNNVNKNLDLGKAIENVRLTQSLGIKTHLTFMFGMPGETKASIKRTISLAKQLNPDSVQFSIMTPLPGTKIYDELENRGHLLIDDYDQYNGNGNSVIRTASLSAQDLEKAVNKAWRAWFLHKALNNLSQYDIPALLKTLPHYLRKPAATIKQLKNLIYG